jgi:5'-nucleotidase
VTNKLGKEVLVNQVGFGGLILGRIDFFFEKAGRQLSRSNDNNPVK